MPQRIKVFLVVLLLMFPGYFFGQVSQGPRTHQGDDCQTINPLWPKEKRHYFQPAFSFLSREKKFSGPEQKSSTFNLLRPLPADFYTTGLGFFCRQEWRLDKLSPVALRFRLGSLDYVNWMEQKPNATKPPH